MKSVQIRSFLWSVFSLILREGKILTLQLVIVKYRCKAATIFKNCFFILYWLATAQTQHRNMNKDCEETL